MYVIIFVLWSVGIIILEAYFGRYYSNIGPSWPRSAPAWSSIYDRDPFGIQVRRVPRLRSAFFPSRPLGRRLTLAAVTTIALILIRACRSDGGQLLLLSVETADRITRG